MKEFTYLCLIILCTNCEQKTHTMNENLAVAQQAFEGWHVGENTGDYTAFKQLLTEEFDIFDHPLAGRFRGSKAREQINKMIAGREQTPNELRFSEVQITPSGKQFYFLFKSEGPVLGKFYFDGYNIIVLSVEEGKLTGFREYLGAVDPAWFKDE